MKKLLAIFTAYALAATMMNAQNFEWARTCGGTDYDEAFALSVDASGNVYTAGYFTGTADFDPGAGTYNLSSAGYSDVFIQKLDAAGNFIWAKSFGGVNEDIVNSLSVDALGNVYIAGYFYGTADFDPGAGTYNLTSAGEGDVFIQKLDAAGNFIWAKAFGGVYGDVSNSLSVDASGNVYTAGAFRGTADFDPEAGTQQYLTSQGETDVFVHKMSQTSVGVIESDFGEQLLVHPNPSAGDFVIDLGEVYDLTEITITDLNGKRIYTNSLHQTQTVNISLPEVPAGVYLLRIRAGKEYAVVKLVKN